MKNKRISFLSAILILALLFVLVSCTENRDPWEDAVYTEDTTLGEGAKTVQVEVKVDEHTVTFTIKTDAEMLGEALLAHDLITGEEGAYGLMVLTVNGILADYDIDRYYWGFYQDGEYLMTGVDTTPITNGDHYEIVRQK